MRWTLAFVLLAISAQQSNAQTLALDYFAQCVGPASEKQAVVLYESQPCHFSESCEPFDQSSFAADVESGCLETAFEICFATDDSNGCVLAVLDRLSSRTSAMAEDFTIERVNAATAGKEDGDAQALISQINRFARASSGSEHDCPVQQEQTALLNAMGIQRDTLCQMRQSFRKIHAAHEIVRRTLELEAVAE
ncbi:MAG: hypothetical protein AAFU41_07030 [Pseudomonadota bacterium]